jgi:integrase
MISLGEICKWYLDLPEVISLSSYNTLKGRLGNPVYKIGEKLRVSELSLELIRQYSVSRSQDSSPWKKQDHIATATIHKEISSLKSMLNTAVRYNKIETNPIMDASMPKLSNSRMLTISHEDYLHLLECSEEHIKPVLTMAYYEPMRKDEIIRLTWKEVDIKAGFIRLAASRTKGGIEGRSIPIHPEVRKMLSSLPRSFQSNRVFLRRVNEQFEQFNDFRKSWKSARKKAGLDDFVFHDFRHVAISNLRKAGNSPTVIMKASGHKTMSMFLRYNLVDEEDLKGMRWIERKTEIYTKDISVKISA